MIELLFSVGVNTQMNHGSKSYRYLKEENSKGGNRKCKGRDMPGILNNNKKTRVARVE